MKRFIVASVVAGMVAVLAYSLAWGGGRQGPLPFPGGGPGPAAPPVELPPSEMDLMAEKPYRPEWAPLPVLRGELAAVPALHKFLESADAATRARAAFVLGQIGCPTSVRHLKPRVHDEDWAVRVQVGIALACMGDQSVLPICALALRSEAPWIRYYAVYGLWCMQSPEATEVLRNNRAGQGELVARAIDGALQTEYVAPPPVEPLGQQPESAPLPAADQVWEQAADALVRESDWWWHKGDYEQAIRCHEASILLDPDWPEAYAVIAWLEWSLGRDEDALKTLHRGVAAAPKDPEAHFALGYHYFNTKRYELAEGPLAQAVELGGDTLAGRTYAHCLEKLGKLREALAAWEGVLKVNPTDGPALLHRDRLKALLQGGH